MTIWGTALDASGRVLDAAFDALGMICNAIFFGRWEEPKPSGTRAELASRDLLVHEVDLPAATAAEARRMIGLDPEFHLPFAGDQIVFDVIGPLDRPDDIRADRSRAFAVGIAKRDVIAARREELGNSGATVERFTAVNPNGNGAFVLVDDAGERRRRQRRFATALAFAMLAASATWSYSAVTTALDEAEAQSAQRRIVAERRVRLLLRELAQTRELEARLAAAGPRLDAVSEDLAKIAATLPQTAELTQVKVEPTGTMLEGRAANADQVELALRRAFDGRSISQEVRSEGEEVTFVARIGAIAPAEKKP